MIGDAAGGCLEGLDNFEWGGPNMGEATMWLRQPHTCALVETKISMNAQDARFFASVLLE